MDQPQGVKHGPVLTREYFFPTMIYYRDLPEAVALNAEIKPHIYRWREEDEEGIVRSNVKQVGAWHSKTIMTERAEYAKLAHMIIACAQVIFDNLDYEPESEPFIDNMWANVNPKFAYNRSHVHPNVLWSGVYYVQSNDNSGRILFTDPRSQANVLNPRYARGQQRKPEVWSEVHYQPIEGRILFFPSWLAHEVEPNLCDKEGRNGDRISISFNIGQRRKPPN
jgi:uncharacterized protein (TIGR02466 family)